MSKSIGSRLDTLFFLRLYCSIQMQQSNQFSLPGTNSRSAGNQFRISKIYDERETRCLFLAIGYYASHTLNCLENDFRLSTLNDGCLNVPLLYRIDTLSASSPQLSGVLGGPAMMWRQCWDVFRFDSFKEIFWLLKNVSQTVYLLA